MDDARDAILPRNGITQDYILITRLKPSEASSEGEAIHIEATPKLGTGAEHACWSPVCLCTFRNTMDAAAAQLALEERLKDAQEQRKKKGKPAVDPEEFSKRFYIMDAQRYYFLDKRGEPRAFTFSLESTCGLRPSFLVFEALRILANKLELLANRLKPSTAKIEVEDARGVTVTRHSAVEGLWEVNIQKEGHTLGNMIQSTMDNQFVPKEYAYIGYYQSHPLEENVTLKILPAKQQEEVEFRKEFAACLRILQMSLLDLIDEWVTFSKLPRTLRAVKAHFDLKIKARPY